LTRLATEDCAVLGKSTFRSGSRNAPAAVVIVATNSVINYSQRQVDVQPVSSKGQYTLAFVVNYPTI
jgi:hypothetical protein